jgi:hypothetical protein
MPIPKARNRSCLRKIEYVAPVCSKDFTEEADRTITKPRLLSAVVAARIIK